MPPLGRKIMKRFLCIFLSLWLLMLCGCTDSSTVTDSTEQTEDDAVSVMQTDATDPSDAADATDPTETEAPEPITVYAGATEDYLLPLEDYSWEREYQPEIVMLHFCSAVLIDWDDPYNLELVRGTFVTYSVSIHYIIDREGTVYCYIPEDRVARHAGVGTFGDDEKYTDRMNYYSIGIELVGMGSQEDMSVYMIPSEYAKLDPSLMGFTDAQYDSLRLLVEDLCLRYQIPMDRDHIIGHDEYAPGKTDPGELFDWDRLLN